MAKLPEKVFKKDFKNWPQRFASGVSKEGNPDSVKGFPCTHTQTHTLPCIFQGVNFHFLKFLAVLTPDCFFGKGFAVKTPGSARLDMDGQDLHLPDMNQKLWKKKNQWEIATLSDGCGISQEQAEKFP